MISFRCIQNDPHPSKCLSINHASLTREPRPLIILVRHAYFVTMGLWKCRKATVTKTIVLSVINTAGPAFRIIPFILCLSLLQKDQIHLARSDMQNFVKVLKV